MFHLRQGRYFLLFFLAFSAVAAEQPEIEYAVSLTLLDRQDQALTKALQQQSKLEQANQSPPASLAILRYRARKDQQAMQKLLRSEGYYASTIEHAIITEKTPIEVQFKVTVGPDYRLTPVTIEIQPTEADFQPPTPEELKLVSGNRALAQPVLDAETQLVTAARQQGFPFAKMTGRSAVVNHQDQSLTVSYQLDVGAKAVLGQPHFGTIDSVDPEFLISQLAWTPGKTTYKPDLINKSRQSLINTKLFSMVRIRLADQLDADGFLPVYFDLTERNRRTVRAGLDYATNEGLGINLSWEDRNLLGGGERLNLSGKFSSLTKEMTAAFREPYFYHPKQQFLALGSFSRETTDAYDSTAATASAGIERTFDNGIDLSAALSYKLSKPEAKTDESDDDTFGLLYFPVQLNWDQADDPLNPTRGHRLNIQLAPYQDTLSQRSLRFTKLTTRYRHYLGFGGNEDKKPPLVLAGRVAWGSIFGAERAEIPADERFYAGGGGSVRGYGYQLLGPLDDTDAPLGGRSLLELSVEARVQMTQQIGVVGFMDGGGVFEELYPSLGEEFRHSAGLGLRYLTPIGPLRFDVAIPLDKREGVDDNYELYLSIGQAF